MSAPQPSGDPRPRFRYIDKLYELFDEYVAEVDASPLSDSSKLDYRYFAECFVRWMHNDYTPGQGVRES